MIPPQVSSGRSKDPSPPAGDSVRGSPERRAGWRSTFTPYYTRAQLFVPRAGEYTEAVSTSLHVRTGEWQSIEIHLPAGIVPEGPLRFDPADGCGIVEISGMQLVHPDSPEPLWSGASLTQELSARGTAISLRTEGVLSVLSYGHDPMLVLPDLGGVPAGSFLRVRMRARIGENSFLMFLRLAIDAAVSTGPSGVARELLGLALTAPEEAVQMLDSLQADRETLRATNVEITALKKQLGHTDAELAAARQECNESREDANLLRAQLEEARSAAHSAWEQHRARVLQLERDLESSRAESAQARGHLAVTEHERNCLHESLQAVRSSWSWRLTAALRSIGALFLPR